MLSIARFWTRRNLSVHGVRLLTVLVLVGVLWFGGGVPAAYADPVSCDSESLIAAINFANSNSGPDTLTLTAGCTYTLAAVNNSNDGSPNGLPAITTNITINSNGATITRDSGAPDFRIFYVGPESHLTLNDVTVSNGHLDTSGFGGAIRNRGTTIISGSHITGNSAGIGGAISNHGTLTVNTSTFTGNTATLNQGGAIANFATVLVTRSTFDGNSAYNNGGALDNAAFGVTATATIIDSTLSGNKANGVGGGALLNYANDIYSIAILKVRNSTLVGNTATGYITGSSGGGIFNFGGGGVENITIEYSTLIGNTGDIGGGINNNGDTVTVKNSIIAESLISTDCVGAVSAIGANFDTDSSCGGFTHTTAAALNLGSLMDNGGPTETVALGGGSVAIDTATPDCNIVGDGALTADQRGIARPQGAACDVGAFESTSSTKFFTVTKTADTDDGWCDEDCSLREAITAANLHPNGTTPDEIHFDIPGSGPHTIAPTSALPSITDPVIIDGLTQPGASCTEWPPTLLIEINGSSAGVGASGLTLTASGSGSTVRGLVINRFGANGLPYENGLNLDASDNNIIQCNFIGVSTDGTSDLGNGDGGIAVFNGSDNNLIGGAEAGQRNLIAGNDGHGIDIAFGPYGSVGNVVQGNYIGTDVTGTIDLGNGGNGVLINYDSTGNTIGGVASGARNVVSGNGFDGVEVNNGSSGNVVQGNYIGTNAAGTGDLGNDLAGVLIVDSPSNTVGGPTAAARNIISGNGSVPAPSRNGVFIVGASASGNTVQNNYIGTDVNGTAALGNTRSGVAIIYGANHNTVKDNLISANTESGVYIQFGSALANVVQGNLIGTDKNGTAPLGNGYNGVTLDQASGNIVGGTGEGQANTIAFNTGDGVLVTVGEGTATGNVIRGNSIHDNTDLGIDLGFGNGGDGVTLNDLDDPDTGANNLQNFPAILSVVPGASTTTIKGRLNSTPGTTFTIDFYDNVTCDPSSYGEGRTYVGTTTTTTDAPTIGTNGGDAFFTFTLPAVLTENHLLTATATDPAGNTSEFSGCTYIGPDNTAWPDALRLDVLTSNQATKDQFLSKTGEPRWYKFQVKAGDLLNVTLTNLPANYDLTIYKDIQKEFDSLTLAGVKDLNTLSAQFADAAFSPDRFSPDRFSPDRFSPEAYSPDRFSPDRFSADVYSPDRFSTDTFAPDRFSQDAYAPDRFSPDRFSPDRFSPDRFSPDRFSTDPTAYENAQMRALVAVSAFNGTASEGIAVNTWLNAGDYYVRVVGRNGASNPDKAFKFTVNRTPSNCGNINPDSLPAGNLGRQAGVFDTVILIDSTPTRMTIDAALTQRLTQLAGMTNGVVVDVSADARVAAANVLADANKPCPFAKNLVAQAIKRIVDLYRPIKYVVIIGGDSVIPFFRQPDQSLLAPESQYAPPVRNDTASQAALKLNFVLTQDFYGAQTFISFDSQALPVPDVAVGRLVETPAEIVGMIDAFVATNGVITPTAPSLVTGYDFLSDVALAVQDQLNQGTGRASDTLIADPTLSPLATSSPQPLQPPFILPWNATQLSNALLGGARHDIAFLAGHFSANSALAADYNTRLTTAQVLASNANLTNMLIFSAGCHSGYNIVDQDKVSAITDPYEIDWAQTLARKQAMLIGGTGYQYGDDEFIEYSERLYLEFAKQLRTGPFDVPIGQALLKAKQVYLANTPQMKGIHAKAYLESTLWGLPMMKVRMPGTRLTPPSEGSIVTSLTGFAANPGAALGLQKFDVNLPTGVSGPQTKTLTPSDGNTIAHPPITTTFFTGPNGVVSNQVEPLLPLSTFNVTGPHGPVLRGVGFRSGHFTDYPGVVPLTGSTTTELRGVRGLFTSTSFYPVRPWKVNYYDAITNPDAGAGAVRLNLFGAQYMSASANSDTGTMRVYSDMNFRLYYSSNTDADSAQSAPPAIVRAFAASNGGDLNFTAVVVGDPTAGVQEVWVTYFDLNNLGAGWQSVNLEQDPNDSTLWTKTLSFANPASIRYIVQAVNGVGLVTLSDNMGAYYQADIDPGAPPPAPPPNQPPSGLAFVFVPTSGDYGGTTTVTAKLTSGGNPVSGADVSLKLGFQTKLATTDNTGQATATFNLVELPGSYQISAEFGGTQVVAPAPPITTPFVLSKQLTTLTLAPTLATVNVGQDSGMTATLSGTGGPLGQQTVVFEVKNGSTPAIIISTITDLVGVSKLGVVNLPPGTYDVTAHFGDNVLSGLDLTSPTYRPSTTATGALTIRVPFPANGVLDNFNRSNRNLDSGGKPWKGNVKGYRIVSQKVVVDDGGPIYWNNPSFGVNQEAFVKLTKVDKKANEQDLLLKVQSGPGDKPDWQKGAIEILYDARANKGNGAVRVETFRPGNRKWTIYANIAVTFRDGDQLGGQVLNDGTVKIYKNGALVGTVTLSTVDRNFFKDKGGKIGLWFIEAEKATFDDFGGGTFTP